MKHTCHPRVTSNEIVRHVDQGTNGELQARIKSCPACTHAAKEMRVLQAKLITRLYRVTCPTSLELGEYKLGMLDKQRAYEIKNHLVICQKCRQEFALL